MADSVEEKMAADQARVRAAVEANRYAMLRPISVLQAHGLAGEKLKSDSVAVDTCAQSVKKVANSFGENQVTVTPKHEPHVIVTLNERPVVIKSIEH